jgi:hypothetical protein
MGIFNLEYTIEFVPDILILGMQRYPAKAQALSESALSIWVECLLPTIGADGVKSIA